MIGKKVFCNEIKMKDPDRQVDWRLDLLVEMKPIRPPSEISSTCQYMMTELGLDYGAFDIRITPGGEAVFFEVNPAGQFLFCELGNRLELTEALCELLLGERESCQTAPCD